MVSFDYGFQGKSVDSLSRVREDVDEVRGGVRVAAGTQLVRHPPPVLPHRLQQLQALPTVPHHHSLALSRLLSVHPRRHRLVTRWAIPKQPKSQTSEIPNSRK